MRFFYSSLIALGPVQYARGEDSAGGTQRSGMCSVSDPGCQAILRVTSAIFAHLVAWKVDLTVVKRSILVFCLSFLRSKLNSLYSLYLQFPSEEEISVALDIDEQLLETKYKDKLEPTYKVGICLPVLGFVLVLGPVLEPVLVPLRGRPRYCLFLFRWTR